MEREGERMEKRISILLFAMALCVLNNEANGRMNEKARESFSAVERKLKLLNKPAVKTIKSEDGDLIDCVDIYKQPAFDHPALKNHNIQMRPSFELATATSSTKHENSQALVSQTWQRSGSCPSGTIPIRRVRREDLLRANSLDDFGGKHTQIPNSETITAIQDHVAYFNNSKVSLGPVLDNRSIAILYTHGEDYIGASGDINVWNPHVEGGEYSSAQIWLKASSGTIFESMEAGWVVHPALYGDFKTRFFGYWTVDSYRSTGCFDLTCPGFVQTSSEIAFGAVLEPSDPTRIQYTVTINIYLDAKTGHWWLKFNNITFGYWPQSLFSNLKSSANIVQWGGDVYSTNVRKTPHTKTAMGSGRPAEDLFNEACFINNARIVDNSLTPKYPESVGTYTDEQHCYTVFNYIEGGKAVEPVFFFGGPGQSYHCP